MAELREKWLNLEVEKLHRITSTQLIKFYMTCLAKYMAAVIEPGIIAHKTSNSISISNI